MELGSYIDRIIRKDDTLTNIIIRPTCLIACLDYEPNKSDENNDSLDGLNLERSGSREWFCNLGIMFGRLTNLTQLTFDGLDPDDKDLGRLSQLMAIQTLQAGEFVGYGSLFKADKTTRVGVVACGYADGYPRHAKAGTPVLVDGQRVPLIGRVSMDMLTVDVTALPNVEVGSQVTLWGEGLAIDEVAAASGTIGYELMCAIAPRVARAEKN